jgi:hypothetical protein
MLDCSGEPPTSFKRLIWENRKITDLYVFFFYSDRYTNTGLKDQCNVTTTNLPQNIALPPMSAAPTVQQMIPALFNVRIILYYFLKAN